MALDKEHIAAHVFSMRNMARQLEEIADKVVEEDLGGKNPELDNVSDEALDCSRIDCNLMMAHRCMSELATGKVECTPLLSSSAIANIKFFADKVFDKQKEAERRN